MVEILLVFLCRHFLIYPNITYYSIYKNFRVIVIFYPQNLYISKKSGIFVVETLKTTTIMKLYAIQWREPSYGQPNWIIEHDLFPNKQRAFERINVMISNRWKLDKFDNGEIKTFDSGIVLFSSETVIGEYSVIEFDLNCDSSFRTTDLMRVSFCPLCGKSIED